MRSSKNKNPCFDCLASEKENEEVCRTIRAILNKHNSVQVDLNDPGSIGTLTIGDCTFNVYLGGTTLNRLSLLPDKDVYRRVFTLIEAYTMVCTSLFERYLRVNFEAVPEIPNETEETT